MCIIPTRAAIFTNTSPNLNEFYSSPFLEQNSTIIILINLNPLKQDKEITNVMVLNSNVSTSFICEKKNRNDSIFNFNLLQHCLCDLLTKADEFINYHVK